MAGDWLKMTHSLPDKPEVLAIAQQLGITRFEVVGRLHILWRWFDTQTKDGHAKSVTSVTVAACLFGDELGTKFVDSLKSVGWLIEDECGVRVPNFDYHISESAKTRAQSGNRKKNQRAREANQVTEMSRSERDKSVTREEKKREEKNKSAGSRETTIADDFAVSDAVRAWAEKNGHKHLDKHLANFIESCKAKGYKYIDWDAAFRKAIAANWAKVDNSKPESSGDPDELITLPNGQQITRKRQQWLLEMTR